MSIEADKLDEGKRIWTSVRIGVVTAMNVIFAMRMRGRVPWDGRFGGGHGETTMHHALKSHFGVLDGGTSLECGGGHGRWWRFRQQQFNQLG